MRPCTCDKPGCLKCRLFNTNPAVNELWGGNGNVSGAAPADRPDDCGYLGRELTGPERVAAGLDHARRWAFCGHPRQPLGQHVCPCAGCGPGCGGYSLDPADRLLPAAGRQGQQDVRVDRPPDELH